MKSTAATSHLISMELHSSPYIATTADVEKNTAQQIAPEWRHYLQTTTQNDNKTANVYTNSTALAPERHYLQTTTTQNDSNFNIRNNVPLMSV